MKNDVTYSSKEQNGALQSLRLFCAADREIYLVVSDSFANPSGHHLLSIRYQN